mgnify:CR=1 FL=1
MRFGVSGCLSSVLSFVVVVVVFCDSKLPLPQTLSFRKVGLCNAVGSPDIRCLL